MPRFSYVARDKSGKRETGVQEAFAQEEVINNLQAKGWVVISVVSLDAVERARTGIGARRKIWRYRATSDDLSLFARQLATMLDAGITLIKSLDVIAKQVSSQLLFITIQRVKQDVERGLTLRDAIGKHPRVFSEIWLDLVETGEASGNL